MARAWSTIFSVYLVTFVSSHGKIDSLCGVFFASDIDDHWSWLTACTFEESSQDTPLTRMLGHRYNIVESVALKGDTKIRAIIQEISRLVGRK